MSQPPRVPRSQDELVVALRQHVALLREYSQRAFVDGRREYLGEVAGKLRVLAYESRTNKPLLLGLMDELNIEVSLTFDKPGGRRQATLRQHLDDLACAVQTPSRGLVAISNNQFLATWAQQQGASHEDWEQNEEFVVARDLGLQIGGSQLRT